MDGRRAGDGWQYERASVADKPIALFDEFDKGDTDQRRMVWTYFQGHVDAKNAGTSGLPLKPVPVVASNYPTAGGRLALLRPEYRRRSVVLDVGTDKAVTAHLEDALTEFYAGHRWRGLLRLAELRPPADAYKWAADLAATVPNVLTDEGEELFAGARALELLALGRAALYGAHTTAEPATAP